MKAIADFVDQELHWSQPSAMHRAYELRAGDALLATLQFRGGTLAEAETAEGRWTLKRQGFWHPEVTIRTLGSDADIAVFKPHMGGGGQVVAGVGAGLEFTSANFWHSEWEWKDQGRSVITYRGPGGLLKVSAAVVIAPDARRLENAGLLAVLGWYLMLLFQRDVATRSTPGATVVTVMH